jgi:putative tryptophan/tyrosine transport system substrate-binding protein
MRLRHRLFQLGLAAMLLSLSFPVEAQQTAKIPRIGYVSGTGNALNQGPYVEALRQGLKELGYIEGKNFKIEYRGAEGKSERVVEGLVAELVQLNVDVLVVPILSAILAAKQATKTIPIVMVAGVDSVATGIVNSLARPGANITGLNTLSRDLSGKRIQLLTEIVPQLSKIGVLRDGDSKNTANRIQEYESEGRALKINVQSLAVRGSNPDIEGVIQNAAKGRVNALVIISNGNLLRHRGGLQKLLLRTDWPQYSRDTPG